MTTKPKSGPGRGTLLLADISGYTAFFKAVGEAHGAEMEAGTFVPEAYPLLTSLLDGIVERIAPPFELSKLEGDAVFVFSGERDLTLRGSALVGLLASCYEDFRTRVDAARKLMPCSCWACSQIGDLELKFVIHHGDYIVQSIAGHKELLGPNVTMAHLLLKNHVADLIGRAAYVLVTEPAADHLQAPLERALRLTENYDHFPAVEAWVLPIAKGDEWT